MEQISDLTAWLLANAGPTIRCRTAMELLDDPAIDGPLSNRNEDVSAEGRNKT